MPKLLLRTVAVLLTACLAAEPAMSVPDSGSRVPSQVWTYLSWDAGHGTRDLTYGEQALSSRAVFTLSGPADAAHTVSGALSDQTTLLTASENQPQWKKQVVEDLKALRRQLVDREFLLSLYRDDSEEVIDRDDTTIYWIKIIPAVSLDTNAFAFSYPQDIPKEVEQRIAEGLIEVFSLLPTRIVFSHVPIEKYASYLKKEPLPDTDIESTKQIRFLSNIIGLRLISGGKQTDFFPPPEQELLNVPVVEMQDALNRIIRDIDPETSLDFSSEEKAIAIGRAHAEAYQQIRTSRLGTPDEFGAGNLTYTITNDYSARDNIHAWMADGYLTAETSFLDVGSGEGIMVHMVNGMSGAKSTGIEGDGRLIQVALSLQSQLAHRGMIDSNKVTHVEDYAPSEHLRQNYDFVYIYMPFDRDQQPAIGVNGIAKTHMKPGAILVVSNMDVASPWLERVVSANTGKRYYRRRERMTPKPDRDGFVPSGLDPYSKEYILGMIRFLRAEWNTGWVDLLVSRIDTSWLSEMRRHVKELWELRWEKFAELLDELSRLPGSGVKKIDHTGRTQDPHFLHLNDPEYIYDHKEDRLGPLVSNVPPAGPAENWEVFNLPLRNASYAAVAGFLAGWQHPGSWGMYFWAAFSFWNITKFVVGVVSTPHKHLWQPAASFNPRTGKITGRGILQWEEQVHAWQEAVLKHFGGSLERTPGWLKETVFEPLANSLILEIAAGINDCFQRITRDKPYSKLNLFFAIQMLGTGFLVISFMFIVFFNPHALSPIVVRLTGVGCLVGPILFGIGRNGVMETLDHMNNARRAAA